MPRQISITLPRTWQELTSSQLYYLYSLFADNLSTHQIKTFCLMKWGGIKIISAHVEGWLLQHGRDKFVASAQLIADAIHALDWIDTLPASPVRIPVISRAKAVDASFMGVPFEKYLYCDNLYQGYLHTQDHSLLVRMAEVLYDKPGIKLNRIEKISVFYWWASLKDLFARSFSSFLQPLDGNGHTPPADDIGDRLKEAMNAQIRALTKGDITKEKEVLAMDTWRAMTELNAQAKEHEELKRKYGNNQ